MSTIICPNGHENLEGNEYCAKCGAKLPREEETVSVPPTGIPSPVTPTTSEQTPARKRRSPLLLAVGAVILILLVIVGVLVLKKDEKPVNSVGSEPASVTHSLTGVLAANECGGYTQVSAASVEVRDENDKLIGSTTATADVGPHAGYACSVEFTVPDLPKAGFYQVTVGSHDGPTYSYADMEAADWHVDLSLGKPSGGSGGRPTTLRVTYRVEGSSTADLTYQSSGGGTSQKSNVPLPWTFHFKLKQGDFYYVSAQNNGTGAIVCQVLINGRRVKSTKSTGQYSICDASGDAHGP